MEVNKEELRRLVIERDMMGTIHIKSGDFNYVQIQYQYPFTDNSGMQRLAERIVSMLEGSSEVDQLRAENERLRKDAERYRWLCDGNGYFMEEQGLCGHGNEKGISDQQIDAAMARDSGA